jgi:hypothetical protein
MRDDDSICVWDVPVIEIGVFDQTPTTAKSKK